MIINSNRSAGLTVGLCVLLSAVTTASAQNRACFVTPLPGGCDPQGMIVQTIRGAQNSIYIQMYALTWGEITIALVEAKSRGVDVRAIVDRREDHTYAIDCLDAKHVTVLVDDKVRGLMHNKIMIVDGAMVVTGSFNYTKAAEHANAENLVLLYDPELVAEYKRYWNVSEAESSPLSAEPPRECKVHDGPVRGNRHSKIYRWPECSDYDDTSPKNRVEFPSAKEAEAQGYRPSQNCR